MDNDRNNTYVGNSVALISVLRRDGELDIGITQYGSLRCLKRKTMLDQARRWLLNKVEEHRREGRDIDPLLFFHDWSFSLVLRDKCREVSENGFHYENLDGGSKATLCFRIRKGLTIADAEERIVASTTCGLVNRYLYQWVYCLTEQKMLGPIPEKEMAVVRATQLVLNIADEEEGADEEEMEEAEEEDEEADEEEEEEETDEEEDDDEDLHDVWPPSPTSSESTDCLDEHETPPETMPPSRIVRVYGVFKPC